MLLTVTHSTHYRYATPASRSTQYIRLTPSTSSQQRVLEWNVALPQPCANMRDAFDNVTHVLTLDRPHQEIRLVASGLVDVADVDDGEPAGRINPKVFLRSTRLTACDAALRAFAEPMRALVRTRPLIGVSDLMNAVLDRLPYRTGVTTADTTAAEAFAAGGGLSQDHTHVFLACCRHLDLPARYVSGYVHSVDRAQVATHAWAEAWLASRWVRFDVSNARQPETGYVRLAIGLDYLDACPVRGVRLGGDDERMSTTATIARRTQA
ncbi:MAG TPA: transglutaminase family protein [Quisquiliibacterium sp.]|nr:transglutaminase family protein [Quisquiliibacterium sp.]